MSYKVIKNQKDSYCELIKNDIKNMADELMAQGYDSNVILEKTDMITEDKINSISKNMSEGIDIGGIMKHIVKPIDIVKLEYITGQSVFCYEVKEKKKSNYFACASYR